MPPQRPSPAASAGPAVLLAALVFLIAGCTGKADGKSPSPGEDTATPSPRAATVSRTPTPPQGKAWVIFGSDTVVAEVARTADERSRGLMYRDEVPPGTGMIFVFDDVRSRSFWMKNTYVALSIAFLDENERVVDIQDMKPEDESFTNSRGPALFALEVSKGWFREHGIKVGDQAKIVFGPG